MLQGVTKSWMRLSVHSACHIMIQRWETSFGLQKSHRQFFIFIFYFKKSNANLFSYISQTPEGQKSKIKGCFLLEAQVENQFLCMVGWLSLLQPHGLQPARLLSAHGILQARILERVSVSFSRGSSRLRNRNRSPALQILYQLRYKGHPRKGMGLSYSLLCPGTLWDKILFGVKYQYIFMEQVNECLNKLMNE